jgi:hypothetical protein
MYVGCKLDNLRNEEQHVQLNAYIHLMPYSQTNDISFLHSTRTSLALLGDLLVDRLVNLCKVFVYLVFVYLASATLCGSALYRIFSRRSESDRRPRSVMVDTIISRRARSSSSRLEIASVSSPSNTLL